MSLKPPGSPTTPIDDLTGFVNLVETYGGLGDDSFDNATALSNAVTGLPANGGTIYIPAGTYRFSSFPVLDGKRSVVFRGQGGLSGGAGSGTRIVFTGTGSGSAISARSTKGVEFHNIEISHSSASFTGTLIDLSATGDKGSASGRGADTQLVVINACRISGLGTANLVDLDRATICSFRDSVFNRGLVGVRGNAATATYSNVHQFFGCTWIGSLTVHVQNADQNWGFFGCTFEQLYDSGGANAGAGALAYAGGTTGVAIVFSGCYFGDANDTGTWIAFTGSGLEVNGSTFSHAATGISTGASTAGIRVASSTFTNLTTAIALGTSSSATVIEGNDFTNGGITAGSTCRGLTVTGNIFRTGVAPLSLDVTSSNIFVLANNMSNATGDVTYTGGGTMPAASFLQRQTGPGMHLLGLQEHTSAVSDASFPATPPNGTVAVENVAGTRKICVRLTGVWYKATLT